MKLRTSPYPLHRLFRDPLVPVFFQALDTAIETIRLIKGHRIIKLVPQLEYIQYIVFILEAQINYFRGRFRKRCTLRGQMKRMLPRRELLDVELRGMTQRAEDLHRRLDESLKEFEEVQEAVKLAKEVKEAKKARRSSGEWQLQDGVGVLKDEVKDAKVAKKDRRQGGEWEMQGGVGVLMKTEGRLRIRMLDIDGEGGEDGEAKVETESQEDFMDAMESLDAMR